MEYVAMLVVVALVAVSVRSAAPQVECLLASMVRGVRDCPGFG
jgi:hypothetical protein